VIKFKIQVTCNHFNKIAARLPKATGVIVRNAASDIEAHAKAVVPVDTKKLKNSIATEMTSATTAEVGPHTDYAVYVEYGTYKMAARPYMTPAADRVRPSFILAMSRLEERLR